MKKLIINCATGESTYVDLTPEELADFNQRQADGLAHEAAAIAAKTDHKAALTRVKTAALTDPGLADLLKVLGIQ